MVIYSLQYIYWSWNLQLNPLQPGVDYLYPLKTSENLGFLMFSGGIDKQYRAVMG